VCDATAPAYAAVSSSALPGWSATVDGRDTPWLVADVMRRAVPVSEGEHRIGWRYHAPGLRLALVLAAVALVVALVMLAWLGRGGGDEPPPPERDDVN
jgi:uncharacterized membrane protein YfhO